MAVAITQAMFFVEIGAGLWASSAALQIDALETNDSKELTDQVFKKKLPAIFDAFATLFGGIGALLVCCWAVTVAFWNIIHEIVPDLRVMAVVGTIALAGNATILALVRGNQLTNPSLKRVRKAAFSDALGNLCVLAAAGGVYLTGEAWPDSMAVAAIFPMAAFRAIATVKNGLIALRSARKATPPARKG